MTRPASTKLTPEVAGELCQRAGVRHTLPGRLPVWQPIRAGLKAVNCQSGDLLAQEQVTAAAKEKVLDALGDAVTKLRGKLGESAGHGAEIRCPAGRGTTSSLEALRAHSLGEKAFRESGSTAALPYHQRAIHLDPGLPWDMSSRQRLTTVWVIAARLFSLAGASAGAKAGRLREIFVGHHQLPSSIVADLLIIPWQNPDQDGWHVDGKAGRR